jgi:hypothetical protein
MTTQENSTDSSIHPARRDQPPPDDIDEFNGVVNSFVRLYDARATFFDDTFVKKVKEGNRKALAELLRHRLPPTQMDLRQEFAKCLQSNIPDAYIFRMNDSKRYSFQELKRLVPEWATLAEKALMASDPALADKLMSQVQWNAKCAFEVTFANAMNELSDLKKTRKGASLAHYLKWTIDPLEKAIEQVKAVDPPGNALIGYGNRITLSGAISMTKSLRDDFRKAVAQIKD